MTKTSTTSVGSESSNTGKPKVKQKSRIPQSPTHKPQSQTQGHLQSLPQGHPKRQGQINLQHSAEYQGQIQQYRTIENLAQDKEHSHNKQSGDVKPGQVRGQKKGQSVSGIPSPSHVNKTPPSGSPKRQIPTIHYDRTLKPGADKTLKPVADKTLKPGPDKTLKAGADKIDKNLINSDKKLEKKSKKELESRKDLEKKESDQFLKDSFKPKSFVGRRAPEKSADIKDDMKPPEKGEGEKMSATEKEKSKPTSRLMAMKNRLRQAQKKKEPKDKDKNKDKEARLKKSNSMNGDLGRHAGIYASVNGGNGHGSNDDVRRMQRSHTAENLKQPVANGDYAAFRGVTKCQTVSIQLGDRRSYCGSQDSLPHEHVHTCALHNGHVAHTHGTSNPASGNGVGQRYVMKRSQTYQGVNAQLEQIPEVAEHYRQQQQQQQQQHYQHYQHHHIYEQCKQQHRHQHQQQPRIMPQQQQQQQVIYSSAPRQQQAIYSTALHQQAKGHPQQQQENKQQQARAQPQDKVVTTTSQPHKQQQAAGNSQQQQSVGKGQTQNHQQPVSQQQDQQQPVSQMQKQTVVEVNKEKKQKQPQQLVLHHSNSSQQQQKPEEMVTGIRGSKSGGGLRVTDPSDIQTQPNGHAPHAAGGRVQATPRRHTVTIGGMDLDTPTKGKLGAPKKAVPPGPGPGPGPGVVVYDKEPPGGGGPNAIPAHMMDDSLDEDRLGEFRRGGMMRSSLPIVRSPNKTLEKPLGLVFLVFRNETKRALLPNEVTSIDTVRALFVRSFPNISLQFLERNNRKIYVLDQHTNLYYELEDLKDVKDRCVLKVYERDVANNGIPNSPAHSPKMAPRGSYVGSDQESDSSTRSAPPGMAAPRSPVHHQRPYSQDFSSKAQSLPVQSNYVYQQQMSQYGTYGTVGPAPTYPGSPTHQMLYQQPGSNQNSPQRAAPQGPYPVPQSNHINGNHGKNRHSIHGNSIPYRHQGSQSTHSSPQRVPRHASVGPNQRHSVAYLPEPNAVTAGFQPQPLPASRSYQDYYDGSRSGSATPTASESEARERMEKMEYQLANLTAWVQTAVLHKDGSRPSSARSNTSLTSDTSNSAKSSLSDLSSATPTQPVMNVDKLKALQGQARDLKEECRSLRRLQLSFQQSMKDELNAAYRRIQEVLPGVPGAADLPVRAQRLDVNQQVLHYRLDTQKIDQDLKDLETSVDELRGDVLNKRCRVNMSEVEMMALALSNVSKALSDLKAKFPLLQDKMKTVMSNEMECVVKEEKFIREEPQRLENALKRCKKMTGTLFTLKRASQQRSFRLASVQEQRPPAQVNIATSEPAETDRKTLLDNIQAIAPNHEARLNSLEAAEKQQERKKKLVTSQDALRFEKALELQVKQLKEVNGAKENGVAKQQDNGDVEQRRASMPLTDTTKRLSLVGKEEGSPQPPEGGLKSQEVSTQQTPPPKPPRTMMYEEAPPTSATVTYGTKEMMTVKNGTPLSTSTPKPNSVFSTFGATVLTSRPSPIPSMANKNTDSVNTSPSKAPAPISSATAVGKQTHVTFASTVTEIRDSSPSSRAALNDSLDSSKGGSRKVPPPPPPRRSSRLATHSPPGNQPKRAFSPPAYENIENFNIKPDGNDSGSSEITTEVQTPQAIINNLNALSHTTPGTAAKSDPPAARGRPMTKFQQELAAGIYANMNRPDLQGQKMNHAKAVRNVESKSEERNSDSESTCSSLDSQTGVILKRAYTRQESPSGENKTFNTDGVKMRQAKKTPPPPPVRRSSALSTIQKTTIPEDGATQANNSEQAPLANGEDKKV